MPILRCTNTFLALVLAIVPAVVPAPALAQERDLSESSPATRTGDAWVDDQLDDINRYAAHYRDAFVDELVRYHGAPRQLVLDLLERGWPPGDIYYACALGSVTGHPCRLVVERYAGGEVPDWHVVVRRIGVETGSRQYGRLKRGLVASYGRWGRPIQPEAGSPTSAPRERGPAADQAVAGGPPAAPAAGTPDADAKPLTARPQRPDVPRRGD
jgi:hypothetical protein